MRWVVPCCITFMLAILLLCYKQYNKGIPWNYNGQAAVLMDNPPYEFVGTTDIALNGEVFGKYFLGDMRVEMFENLHTHKEEEHCYGIITMYHYHLDTKGEAYVKEKERRKTLADGIIKATTGGEPMPGVKMMRLGWYEWTARLSSDEKVTCNDKVTGYLYYENAGRMPFVLRVSVRGRALIGKQGKEPIRDRDILLCWESLQGRRLSRCLRGISNSSGEAISGRIKNSFKGLFNASLELAFERLQQLKMAHIARNQSIPTNEQIEFWENRYKNDMIILSRIKDNY